jgi:hypothetical protein
MSNAPRATARSAYSFSLGELLAIVFVAAYLLTFLQVEFPNSGPGPVRRLEVLTLLTVPDAVGGAIGKDRAPGWFVERTYLLAMTAGYLTVAAMFGSLQLRWLKPQVAQSRVEQWVFALGLGLAGISLTTFLLGVFGLLLRWLFLGIAALIAIGFIVARPARTARPSAEQSAEPNAGIGRGWLWMVTPLVLLLVLSAMLPPRDFDVLEYHLQAPKEFYQNGSIGFLPHNVYANMPLGAEMHALAAIVVMRDWYAGALVGKTVIACFALITAAGIYAFGCRFLSRSAGVVGAIVYLTTPWVLLVSAGGLIDGVVGCYTLLAIYALVLWRQAPVEQPELATRRLILCGLMAGTAVSCKYPAVVFLALPVVGYAAWCGVVPRNQRSWLYGVMVLLGAMAVPAGPWFVKNWVLTGNPTYPLLYSVFDGATRTPEKDAQWRRAHAPPNYAPSDLGRRIHDVLLGSTWLGLATVPLAAIGVAAAALRRRKPRQDRSATLILQLAAYCLLVFALWWLLTHRIDRFLVPLLPIAAILAGSAFATSPTKLRSIAGIGLLILANCYATAIALFSIEMARLPSVFALPEPWHRLPTDPNETDQLLLVGGAAVFSYREPVLYNTCFDECRLEKLIAGKSATEAKAALHAAGITHIAVDWGELARYRSPGNYGYSNFPTKELFDRLVAEGVLKPQPGYYSYPYQVEGFKVVR